VAAAVGLAATLLSGILETSGILEQPLQRPGTHSDRITMKLKTRAIVGLGVGAFLSLPTSAVIFNLLPQVAVPLSALVCSERLEILPSSRNHSHTYLCAGTDITVRASVVVWVALVLVLAGVIFMLLPGDGAKRR
jgi:hypothetical protein